MSKVTDTIKSGQVSPIDVKMPHGFEKVCSLNLANLCDMSLKQVFRFGAQTMADGSGQPINEGPVTISLFFFDGIPETKPKLSDAIHRLKISISSAAHLFAFQINLREISGQELLTIYSYITHSEAAVQFSDFEIIALDSTAKFSVIRDKVLDANIVTTDLTPVWYQNLNKIGVRFLDKTFEMDVPDGYNLKKVDKKRLEIANILLFDHLLFTVFGKSRLLVDKCFRDVSWHAPFRPEKNSKILLSYSTGEDSTAALAILPRELTIPVYCKRKYESYRLSTGFRIELGSSKHEKIAVSKVPEAVVVPNTFEKIGLILGQRHGFVDNFGYGAICLLLADHFQAETIAFGSVLEQVYMKSGNNFTDIRNYKSSRYNRYRDMFESAGIFYFLATGSLSEIVTNSICQSMSDSLYAVPCPSTDSQGNACGVCFKCFRKVRLEGKIAKDPDPSVGLMLEKRPLKSATSVVMAAQRAQYTKHSLKEYEDVDVSHFIRFFGPGLEDLAPPHLVKPISKRLLQLGVQPMTILEEESVRDIAKIFDPENHSESRARPQLE